MLKQFDLMLKMFQMLTGEHYHECKAETQCERCCFRISVMANGYDKLEALISIFDKTTPGKRESVSVL